jgi:hypothetical protein
VKDIRVQFRFFAPLQRDPTLSPQSGGGGKAAVPLSP